MPGDAAHHHHQQQPASALSRTPSMAVKSSSGPAVQRSWRQHGARLARVCVLVLVLLVLIFAFVIPLNKEDRRQHSIQDKIRPRGIFRLSESTRLWSMTSACKKSVGRPEFD